MRRFIAFVVLSVLTACGSSTPTDGNTPPPPPPSATPASVTVVAGDGQQAEPGTPVAQSPSVVVKDAAGIPVSGVAVTFTADSGGGAVTGGSGVTGSNGVASAGSWTLGSTEGRNVLKVTAGSLAPVRLGATARIVGSAFPATTIGSGGGSITISQPGPLNGFKLDVPGGAFAAGLTATVSYATSANIPRTPTMNPVSPLITIGTTTTDFAKSPLTIHISAPTPANTFPVIMVYDPASGASEVLTTIAWDANGVTALATTLNGAELLNATGGSLRSRGASLQGGGVIVFDDAIPADVLLRDYDSGFRPGADDWEFPTVQSELIHVGGAFNSIGPSATSLWYYVNRPSPAKLNGRFQLVAGIPFSDRVGIRWTSVIGASYDIQATNELVASFSRLSASDRQFDRNQFLVLRAKFARAAESGGSPKPQLLIGFTAGDDPDPHYLIVYRVSGDQAYVADPFFPGASDRTLTMPDNAPMAPYGTGLTGSIPLVFPLTIGLSSVLPLDQFPTTYAQVLDGSIGQAQFPLNELHGWDGRLYDTLFVVDTLRLWVECAHCVNGFTTTLSPAPTSNVMTGPFYNTSLPNPLLGRFPTGGFLFSTAPVAGTDTPAGIAVQSSLEPHETAPDVALWVDWHPFVVRKLQTSIAPAAPTGFINTPLSLTHQVTLALLPSSVTYRWDFGDQTTKALVHNVNTVNHTYTTAGTYAATAEILDDRNNQVIGRSTETVTINAPFIDLTVSGNWAENTAPAAGTYHYTDFSGGRVPNASPGVDALVGTYDNTAASNGIILPLVIPAGSALHAGQTFTKFVTGPPIIGAGQFQLTIMVKLNDPDNSHQVAPGTSGTFTVTAITIAADGTGFFSYTFEVSNGAGGTISGSGVSPYK